jgi:hypothetical protein
MSKITKQKVKVSSIVSKNSKGLKSRIRINKYAALGIVLAVSIGGFFAYRSFAAGGRTVNHINSVHYKTGCSADYYTATGLTNAKGGLKFNACRASGMGNRTAAFMGPYGPGWYRVCVWGRVHAGATVGLELFQDVNTRRFNGSTFASWDGQDRAIDKQLICGDMQVFFSVRGNSQLSFVLTTYTTVDITNYTIQRL